MSQVTLNPVLSGLRGKVGNLVLVQQADGRVGMRDRTIPKDPKSPGQRKIRAGMGEAAKAWRDMTPAQMMAWGQFSEDFAPAGTRPLSGYLTFMRLATRFRAVSPLLPLPLLPPSGVFVGDSVRVSISAGTGAVVFTASAPNSTGVVCELLVQSLRNYTSAPIARRYRVRGIVGFVAGGLSFSIPAEPGSYACAVRFVEVATGQASEVLVVGKVVVG